MSRRPPDDDEPRDPPEGGEDRGEEGGEDHDDNVILMPGIARIPEPSPIRHRGAEAGQEPPPPVALVPPPADEDALEELDAAELAAHPPAHLVVPAIEALLFAAEGPLTEAELDEHLGAPGLKAVRSGLLALAQRYAEGSGVRLVQVAKGWQLRTDPRFSRWVARMRGGKPVRLSRAALETLSVVAYRQPVTKSEIDELRGVDCGGVLRMLGERGLVAIAGRRDEPGRPLLYGTTREFLVLFGLRDLSDLPTLRDLRELHDDDPRLGPLGEEGLGQQQLPLAPVEADEEPPTEEGPRGDPDG